MFEKAAQEQNFTCYEKNVPDEFLALYKIAQNSKHFKSYYVGAFPVSNSRHLLFRKRLSPSTLRTFVKRINIAPLGVLENHNGMNNSTPPPRYRFAAINKQVSGTKNSKTNQRH